MGTINTVALEKGIKTAFETNYQQMLNGTFSYREDIQALFTETQSEGQSEKYGFLGDYPEVREWLGEKDFSHLKDYDYTITNKDWETSITVFKNELRDDRMGIIRPRVDGMTRALVDYKADLIVSLLEDGISDNAYDGNAFFSNRTSPNDNLLAGTGGTTAQLQTDLSTVREAMRLFETDRGRKFNFTPDTVIVPANLETNMLKAVKSEYISDSNREYNVNKDQIERVICLPQLDSADPDSWYAVCTAFPLKPFIYQSRERPNLYMIDQWLHVNKELYFTAEMAGNAGYGMFQLAIKVVNS